MDYLPYKLPHATNLIAWTARIDFELRKIPRVKNNRNLNARLSIYVKSMTAGS
jgi:hypothetical protein